MKPKTRFREDILATIHKDRILGICAGSVGYVADMSRSPSRDTTTELVPI